MNLQVIKEQIEHARRAALRDARAEYSYPCVKSRGTFLATALANGDQCNPCPEAEALQWNGTKREIKELVERVKVEFPEVTEVYIAGGYDGAETVRDLIDRDDYQPWVSSWKVTVWTRPVG